MFLEKNILKNAHKPAKAHARDAGPAANWFPESVRIWSWIPKGCTLVYGTVNTACPIA